ncbi:1175_t:CDS:2 [Ambispora gerdemannii]|uniref:1175_t:CDS:1 n=1 Tax=Ambispora gerdemannii TaxID=144530 RepID=A0A9N9CSD9_9GLOM|nr:1175_t:CDS:2 [Ambispora gerdemannii]
MTYSYPTFLSTVPASMTENTVLLLRLWHFIRNYVSIRREGTLVSNGECWNFQVVATSWARQYIIAYLPPR